jgi:hypothetical protein
MTHEVRVVSVPADHPYVRRVVRAAGVSVRADPLPDGADAGRWWPPVALDAGWIRDHASEADLLHLHFGTESFSPEHLDAALDAARDAGWPVVQTVHDLEHPQLRDQESYRRQLDVLVPRADAVVTLTSGAAREIRARWGREAIVLPHPRLLGDDFRAPVGLVRSGALIGLSLKDLRPNVDGPRTTKALIGAIGALRSHGIKASAEVRLHHTVRDEKARDEVRTLCSEGAHVTLIEHERLDDRALAQSLARLDAAVLPYRWGTHSGWLELCWDLGVPVAAPTTGYYAEQHDDATIGSFDLDDPASLARRLEQLLAAGTASGRALRQAVVSERLGERAKTDRATAETHHALYSSLLRDRVDA